MLNQMERYFALAVFVLLMSALPGALFSQDPVFRNFSEEEGLPSNDIYDVLAAKNDLLWFVTDNGVSRYDGHEFVNIDVADGLAENAVLKLYEDLFGRIWFLSYNGKLSYYDQGEIVIYEHNNTIIKYFADNFFHKMCVDSSGGILLSPKLGGKAYIEADGAIHTYQALIPRYIDSCYLSFEDRGDDYFMTIMSMKPDNCTKAGPLFYIDDHYYLRVKFTRRGFQRNYFKIGPGEYIVSYKNWVYFIKDHKVEAQSSFEEEVLSLFLDDFGKLWISIKYDHGIYMFESSMLSGHPVHILDGQTVTKVIQDREGGYWLSTEGNGIYFVPSFDFSCYNLPGDKRKINVTTLAIAGNRLWFATRDKELYAGALSKDRIGNIRKIAIEKPNERIKDIGIDPDGYLWLSFTKDLRYDPAGFPRPPDTVMYTTCLRNGKGDTMIVAHRSIGIYSGGELCMRSKADFGKRIYAVFHDDDHRIWLATLYGLYVFNEGEFFYKGELYPILEERISCIGKINDMLVVGTSAHGLVCLRGDSLAYYFSEENGMNGNSIKSVFAQNDSILWVGTKSGLTRIVFGKEEQGYRIENFGQSDGLPSNEINSIGMHDGYIWLATGNGLVSVDPETLIPRMIPPLIQISGIRINGKDTSLMDYYVLEHDQNDIRINFQGISYPTDEGLKYRFMMVNYQDEIILTNNPWADFPNMPPGDYIFYVNVSKTHGAWNKVPETVRFHIKKRFTQTIWFLIPLILASSLLLAGIIIFFHRQQKLKGKARIDLALMEQKMFRSQMNPHFVFNALLAIQGFMYQNNPRDAGRYLTSFAKLIRHTLYGSSEEYISLDQEIEAMEYYMDLQRLRFNEKFEYHIITEGDLMPESIKIPPMLIQPFIENAIEHGLQHMDGKGELLLSIEMPDVYLKIIIEDNGIGREEAMKLQQKKSRLHKSLGMEIMRKRIAALNLIMDKKISLNILDLKDAGGTGIGTRVTIYIPHRSV